MVCSLCVVSVIIDNGLLHTCQSSEPLDKAKIGHVGLAPMHQQHVTINLCQMPAQAIDLRTVKQFTSVLLDGCSILSED